MLCQQARSCVLSQGSELCINPKSACKKYLKSGLLKLSAAIFCFTLLTYVGDVGVEMNSVDPAEAF